jgi:cytochrome c553
MPVWGSAHVGQFLNFCLPTLLARGNVPALAGRSPIYLVRQMYDFKHAARTGKEVALMIPVVVGLTQDDMLNLAAYISSRQP